MRKPKTYKMLMELLFCTSFAISLAFVGGGFIAGVVIVISAIKQL